MAKRIIVPVQGMTCAKCVAHVQKALVGVPGVADVRVNLDEAQATVWFGGDVVEAQLLAAAVDAAGYQVSTETVVLSIGGMSCDHCVARVERVLGTVPGVLAVDVDLADEKARVIFITGAADASDFKRAVAEAGYEVL